MLELTPRAGADHCGTTNTRAHGRYMQHMAYAAPWLVRFGRTAATDPAFLERTTSRRRMLMGDYSTSSSSFRGHPVPRL